MRYLLLMVLMLAHALGHGQSLKFGVRSGVSFSNFYGHHSPGEIPDYTIQPASEFIGSPTMLDPNLRDTPSYFYKTSLIQDMRAGVYSYLYVDYEIRPRISAQIEVGYTQKGINIGYELHNTSFNSNNNTVNLVYQFNRNLRLDYITVPLTFQYRLDQKERFYAVAGIYNSIAVNFLIKESSVITNKQTYTPSGQFVGSSGSENWTTGAYANRFDAGLIAGVGVNLPLSKKLDIGMDVRGSLGLMNVPKGYEKYGFQSFNKRSKNISLESGIKLQYSLN